MRTQLAEIVGVFLLLAGLCTLVGAAAMVDPALAVAVSGFFLLLVGALVTYVAAALGRKAAAPPPAAERRTT